MLQGGSSIRCSLPRYYKTLYIIVGKALGVEGALGMRKNILMSTDLSAENVNCTTLGTTPIVHWVLLLPFPCRCSPVCQDSVQFFMDCQRNKLLCITKWNWHFKSKTHDINITHGTRYHQITCHLINIQAGGAKDPWVYCFVKGF